MVGASYEKPPITEAIIEFRFTQSTTDGAIQKFAKQIVKQYPESETTYEVQVVLEAGKANAPAANVKTKFGSLKLLGVDQSDLLIVAHNRISACRLAPYTTWEEFSERALLYYGKLKTTCGPRPIARVATRFINRIDVPGPVGTLVKVDDYIKVDPCSSSVVGALSTFNLQVNAEMPGLDGLVGINVATVASPLIDHVSFLLDIDVRQERNPPQSDQGLAECLIRLRQLKNSIFESYLTDKSRDLFNNV